VACVIGEREHPWTIDERSLRVVGMSQKLHDTASFAGSSLMMRWENLSRGNPAITQYRTESSHVVTSPT
jgi:hypothetical protein